MEDYIGARVDYEPKYKDVLTYFQNIGNLYTWEADPWGYPAGPASWPPGGRRCRCR